MLKNDLGWIGNTSYAQPAGRGDYPGAMCKKFYSIKSYNEYFKNNPGLLVIDVTYQLIIFGLFTTVVVMMTNQLTLDELNDMQEVSREIEFGMAKRRADKVEAKEKLAKEQLLKQQEDAKYIAIGKRYVERVGHMRSLVGQERKDAERELNRGDKEILGLTNKEESADYNKMVNKGG